MAIAPHRTDRSASTAAWGTGVRWRTGSGRALRAALAVIAFATSASALDGVALTVRFTSPEPRSIHTWIGANARLVRHDLVGGRVLATTDLLKDEEVGAACISPDGSEAVVFLVAKRVLAVVKLDGSAPAETLTDRLDADPGPANSKDKPIPRFLDWRSWGDGKWIYYSSGKLLGRVHRTGKQVEVLGRFDDPVTSFALSREAQHQAVVRPSKERKQYCYTFGGPTPGEDWTQKYGLMCALSADPEGGLFTANERTHDQMNVWGWDGAKRATIPINQWAGSDGDGSSKWQHFIWAVNHPSWWAACQFSCVGGVEATAILGNVVAYDLVAKQQLWITRNPRGIFDYPAGLWVRPSGTPPPVIPIADPRLEAVAVLDGATVSLHLNPPYLGDAAALAATCGGKPCPLKVAAGGRRLDLTVTPAPADRAAIAVTRDGKPLLTGTVALPAWPATRAGLVTVFAGKAASATLVGTPAPMMWGIGGAVDEEGDLLAMRGAGTLGLANGAPAAEAMSAGAALELLIEPALATLDAGLFRGVRGSAGGIASVGLFQVAQEKDRLIVQLGDTRIDTGACAPAMVHLVASWDGARLSVWRDGVALPASDAPNKKQKGSGFSAAHWFGAIHRLAAWNHPLTSAQVTAQRAALADVIAGLGTRSVVEATVVALAQPINPRELGMYPDALGRGIYTVKRSISGPPLTGTIRVNSWNVVNGQVNKLAMLKPGDTATLILRPWSAAPESVTALKVSHQGLADEAEDAPLFYESGVRP